MHRRHLPRQRVGRGGTGAAAADIGYSSRVLAVIAVDGTILDGAAFSSTASQTTNYQRGRAPGRHHGRVERVHAVALAAATAQAVLVNWSGLSNTRNLTGKSVQFLA